MNITLSQFAKTIPTNRNPQEWYDVLPEFFAKYEINTRNRVAAFLAQTGHESMDFRAINENLNYSASSLRRVFGRYFPTTALANAYARQPEKIANYVYDDRHPRRTNKLGNIYDGDGWKFRGGGLKQLTGRYNYSQFGEFLGMTADEAAAYVRTPAGALESAGWFWHAHNLGAFADRDDIDGMSRAINGGSIGLVERRNRYNRNKALLPAVIDLDTEYVAPEPTSPDETVILEIGSNGSKVKQLQNALGITADGAFGRLTAAAVWDWQAANGYTPTGEVTREQFNSLVKNAPETDDPVFIKIGSRGSNVKQVQSKLGFSSWKCDGIYGPNTASAVQSWQQINNIKPTGELTVSQFYKLVNG